MKQCFLLGFSLKDTMFVVSCLNAKPKASEAT